MLKNPLHPLSLPASTPPSLDPTPSLTVPVTTSIRRLRRRALWSTPRPRLVELITFPIKSKQLGIKLVYPLTTTMLPAQSVRFPLHLPEQKLKGVVEGTQTTELKAVAFLDPKRTILSGLRQLTKCDPQNLPHLLASTLPPPPCYSGITEPRTLMVALLPHLFLPLELGIERAALTPTGQWTQLSHPPISLATANRLRKWEQLLALALLPTQSATMAFVPLPLYLLRAQLLVFLEAYPRVMLLLKVPEIILIPPVITNEEQKLMLNRLTILTLPLPVLLPLPPKPSEFDPVTALRPDLSLLVATLTLPLETASACVLPLVET